jgi:hypothetical protein
MRDIDPFVLDVALNLDTLTDEIQALLLRRP